MLIADIFDVRLCQLLLGSVNLFARLDAHGHDRFHDIVLDHVEHLAEQFKGLALVFLLWIFLRITAQMNPLTQVIERCQMFTPVRVDASQHDAAFETAERFFADDRNLAVIGAIRRFQQLVQQLFIGDIRLRGKRRFQWHFELPGAT